MARTKKTSPVTESVGSETLDNYRTHPSRAMIANQITQMILNSPKEDLTYLFQRMIDQVGDPSVEVPNPGANAGMNQHSIDAKPSAALGYGKAVMEDMTEIFGDTLTEEAREKTANLFQAYVDTKTALREAEIKDVYEDLLREGLETATQDIYEFFAKKVDHYLTYVAEQWHNKNRVPVASHLKSALAESLVEELGSVLSKYKFVIEDQDVDVVESLSEKVVELEDQLNSAKHQIMEARSDAKELAKALVVEQETRGMTLKQADKFRALSESVQPNELPLIRESVTRSKPTGIIVEETQVTEGLLTETASQTGQRYKPALSLTAKSPFRD